MSTAAPARSAAVSTELVTAASDLEAERGAWDALADLCGRPFCQADWLLAWWDHVRPARAQLAVVLVRDDDELIGVAPGFCDRGPAGEVRWTPLGAGSFERVEPLAVPGREAEVAGAVAQALSARRPGPAALRFDGIPAASPWPGLLRDAWPGAGPGRVVRTGEGTAMVLALPPGGYEAWSMAKTSHFRQRLKRSGKAARQAGASFRLADERSAAADVEAFVRVHVARWDARGGSHAIDGRMAAMLRAVAPRMVASGRMRLWSLDLDGEVIASSIVLVAGGEAGYWLNGFDAAHAKLEPSKISILHVVQDAFSLGASRLDLGEGAYAYKRRFADEEEPLTRLSVLLPGARGVHAAAGLAPRLARTLARRHLPEQHQERLRATLRRSR